MARKATDKPRRGENAPRRRTSSKGGAKRPRGDIPGRVISAALDLAAGEGWRSVSMAAIAAKAGLTLAQVHGAFPSKAAIVEGFFGRIDAQVLAGGEGDEDAGDSARDRLFDVLMRRFDALNPHKAAVAAIIRDSVADPPALMAGAPRFLHSMAWMVEAAGLSSAGLSGAVRTEGLALVYLNALRVWLADDTEDMAKTMAALDWGLRQAEMLMQLCGFGAPPGAGEDTPAAG